MGEVYLFSSLPLLAAEMLQQDVHGFGFFAIVLYYDVSSDNNRECMQGLRRK